jgi:hypothetical protein
VQSEPAIKWVKDAGRYTVGQVAMVGRIGIGGIFWDATGPKGDRSTVWVASARLPQLRDRLGGYPTEDEARAHVESAWAGWWRALHSDASEEPSHAE